MRLVVVEFMTLDGVMEAPGFEEHRTGRNGWAMRADVPELAAFNGRQITGASALLFGRTTVRDLATGADLRFDSRGPVALKGVPEPWELFAVSVVGAPSAAASG